MQFKELRTSYENQGKQGNIGITMKSSSLSLLPDPASKAAVDSQWNLVENIMSPGLCFSPGKRQVVKSRGNSGMVRLPKNLFEGNFVEKIPHSLQALGFLFCSENLDHSP